jgi:Cu/Ag efflux pump CusA
VEDQVSGYDEVAAEVRTYTDARVSQVLAADESDVAVRVYGENPEVLASKAQELRSAISDVDGVAATRIEPTPEESTVEVEVDLERAQALGVKPGDVRRAAAILLGSMTVGNLFEEQKVFDVVVWGAPQVRASLSDVARLRLDTPDGGTIRLGDVADVREVPNAAVIRHESVARYVELTANVSGRSVTDVNADVKALVSGTDFPLDHHAEVLGGYAERQAALWRVGGLVAAAFVLVFLLFQAAFRSWRLAALALALLPVASSGALLATLATDGTVTLGVITGALAVLGTSCRAILLSVGHVLHLERREEIEFGPDLVVRGTRDRLVPMLGTVLASTSLLLPIALAGGATGFEILRPAVLAFLGGLVTATVVALFVLPAVHLRIGSVSDADSWVDDLYEPTPDLDTVRT